MEKWQNYIQVVPVDVQLTEERRKQLSVVEKERNDRRNVIPILMDITNTLGRLRLPFRGHDEEETSANKGVFNEIAYLVGRHNGILANHLLKAKEKSKSYPSYISPSSQNEMIHSIACIIRCDIAAEVKKRLILLCV